MLVVIGLIVSPRKESPASPAERAGYQEIVALNHQQDVAGIRVKCERFMRLYPNSKGIEAVAMVLGESLVQSGNWKEAGSYYRGLAEKFPKSENMDRFVFFQGVAFFQEANFIEAIPFFNRVLKSFPRSALEEKALYYIAMSHFLSNDYQETLVASAEYLRRFPDGHFSGDLHYRLSFIDFNDTKEDRSEKIIRDLNDFLAEHPDDAVNGSMLCLLGDTYKKKKIKTSEEAKANEDQAIECYIKAVWTDSPDDVIQYALDSATIMLRIRKDWTRMAAFYGEFLKRKPDNPLAADLAKFMNLEGKGAEAAGVIAGVLKANIADPSNENVEFMIDALVKSLVPRKKASDIDADDLDRQLAGIFDKGIADQENPTTFARLQYARARLAQMLKRNDRSEFYLKEIALKHAKDPTVLSPALLETCGGILLKLGELDGAEAMYKSLKDRFAESLLHSDAGPVGLGSVALARKNPGAALGIFEEALKKPGNVRFNQASLGRIQSLVDLDRLEPAEKLAREIVADRKSRGESAGKALLLLARIYRNQAAKAEGEDARELLKKAHDIYIRVYIAYQSLPGLSAEGIWEASETARELGDEELRLKDLKGLINAPKLENTEPRKKALEEISR